MSSVIDEILLLQASTTEDEFQWNGAKEEINQWQSIISKYEEGENIEEIIPKVFAMNANNFESIPITFRLKLVPQLWLNVDLSLTLKEEARNEPELTLCGPSVDKGIWNKASELLQNLRFEAKRQDLDNIVFDVFTGLQSGLSDMKSEIVKDSSDESAQQPKEQHSNQPEKVEMLRVIFWSHHLKAPSKKRDMNKWCQELQIWGLVKSGYPGFLCFEGLRENVEEIVKRIKSLQWHAITVKTESPYFFFFERQGCPTNDFDIYSQALKNCKLAKFHSSNDDQSTTKSKKAKIRTSMDEVETSGLLVQRLRNAGVPEDEIMFALNLRD